MVELDTSLVFFRCASCILDTLGARVMELAKNAYPMCER